MSEFKKFEVDYETFETICKNAYKAFINANKESYDEDFKEALEKTLFDVKDPFDIEKWNSCKVKPPIRLDYADLIIRKVGVDSIFGVNATESQGSLYTGWYVRDHFSVSGAYEVSVQHDIEKQINEHPEDWEYRVIPFK